MFKASATLLSALECSGSFLVKVAMELGFVTIHEVLSHVRGKLAGWRRAAIDLDKQRQHDIYEKSVLNVINFIY